MTHYASAAAMKRLVDLVDRGPEDDFFFPASANTTIFRRDWTPYHNMSREIVEVGYKGNAAWGSRITVDLNRKETGDLLEWVCLRLKPQSWLGAELEQRLKQSNWDYADPAGAWMWAASLGTAAIAKVELEIGDTLIESWSGDWMDVWSRLWLDGGRAAVWDSDLYGQVPPWVLHDTGRPAWTTIQPTEDGYIYCWLPLAFLRRPQTAFPIVALGDGQEMRLHITLRPFADVVRRRAVERTSPAETPLGTSVTVLDKSGLTPIPWTYTLGTHEPGFEDATVFAGVVHLEDPLRSAYLHVPIEMMYERIVQSVYAVPVGERTCGAMKFWIPLKDLNGPVRELAWFVRRKAAWRYSEWTNYGLLMEDALVASVNEDSPDESPISVQEPILRSATLQVGNAVWRSEDERWWRYEYGMAHRGGVRATYGMVYGFCFGEGGLWHPEDLAPAGTVNASRADIRLELELNLSADGPDAACGEVPSQYEVVVFATTMNWLRFVKGQAVPLFKD
jgi:hypothetical protein